MADGIEFDYELSKANYLALVNKFFEEDSTHSENTISKTIEILKGSEKTHLHKNYEVSREFGRDILIEKKKSPTDEAVQVLSFEDIFDIFMKYHTITNHLGGRRHLLQVEKQFKSSYNYPSVCLTLLLKSCNVCKAKSLAKSAISKEPTKISYVYVTVMIQKRKSPIFQYLLIYLDKATDFIILRPLRQRSVVEIAMEIFKILMAYGPPKKLCFHGYYLDPYKRVVMMLRQVCPMFPFTIQYKSVNYDPAAYVVSKLHEWMNKNISLSWEIGCSIVQKELNKSLSSLDGKKVSPHELFYGPGTELNVITHSGPEDLLKIISKEKMLKRKVKTKSNNGVIELSIPSPENIDSGSDSSDTNLISDSDSNKRIPSDEDSELEIEEEPIVVLDKKSKSKRAMIEKSNDENIEKEPVAEMKITNIRKMSLRSAKVHPNGSSMKPGDFVIDDNFMYESDDDNLEPAIDPLNI